MFQSGLNGLKISYWYIIWKGKPPIPPSMKFRPILDRFDQYQLKLKIQSKWDLGFESFFVKPKRIFLALKYPPWITVENNSTIEKENNGSNGGVKNTKKEKDEKREREL